LTFANYYSAINEIYSFRYSSINEERLLDRGSIY
jgi:hypothetical protein